jgi:hypothetical protein
MSLYLCKWLPQCWCPYTHLWIIVEEDTILSDRAMVYTRTLLGLQFLKTSISRNLGLKCRNQPPPLVQSLRVMLELYHQPLLVMLEIGQQPLQVMLKTCN